jgi:hypothetical protein
MQTSDSTRISDLPEGGANDGGMRKQFPENSDLMNGNQYIPMNIHPNPYGNTIGQPPPMPMSGDSMQTAPVGRLPSRDIPQDTSQYTHDKEIQANYIPETTPKQKSVHFAEDVEEEEESLEIFRQRKQKEKWMSMLTNQIQIPLITIVLYFIFQLSVMKKVMYHGFANLGMYREDGNLNLLGTALKSCMFGLSLFCIQMFLEGLTKTFTF